MEIIFKYGELKDRLIQKDSDGNVTEIFGIGVEQMLADHLAANRIRPEVTQITMPDGEVIDCSNEPEEITVVEPAAIESDTPSE